MLCLSCLWLQGHHKDKNNPQWQICFQKVSHSFSIIPEKYCTIVLTPIERFDRGLMYYPVFPVIQMPPPFVSGKPHQSGKRSVWNIHTLCHHRFWFRWGWFTNANSKQIKLRANYFFKLIVRLMAGWKWYMWMNWNQIHSQVCNA